MTAKTMCPHSGKWIDNPYHFKPGVGTIIEGTLLNRDLIPAFHNVLEDLDSDQAERLTACVPVNEKEPGSYYWPDDDAQWWDGDEAMEVCAELMDALDAHAPTGLYFGAHCGDGSDFGFWPHEDVNDCGVHVVNDADQITEAGEHIHVNERGNVTLYVAEIKVTLHEVWSAV